MKTNAGSMHLHLSAAETWLLVASTQSGATAQAAWDQWRAQCRIETADSDSQAIFSMLYLNLVARLGGPEERLLKGIYKRTWYANQLAFAQLRRLLERFAEHGIPTVLMNDAALVAGYYPDIACRAIRCIDLVVRAEHWDQSVALPTAHGWQKLQGKLPTTPHGLSVTSFSGPAGHTVRIWTNLFTAEPQRDTEARIWDAAQEIELAGRPVLVLGPVEQLLCLSADSFRENDAALFRFADAMRLLASLRSTSDWARLVWQAQRYEHILPLRIMLTFLSATLSVSLPSWVLPALGKMAISHGELLLYRRACDSLPLRVKSTCLRWLSSFRPRAARDR